MAENTKKYRDLFDLSPDMLEKALSDLSTMQIFKAVDGFNGVVGSDNGKIYTAFSESAERYFTADDCPANASAAPIKIATAAIMISEQKISDILMSTVQFTIYYHEDERVAELWFDNNSPDGVKLNTALKNDNIKISVKLPVSIDGRNISSIDEFVDVEIQPPKKISSESEFRAELRKCSATLLSFFNSKTNAGTVRDTLNMRVLNTDTVNREEKDAALIEFKNIKLQILQRLIDAANIRKDQMYILADDGDTGYSIHNPTSKERAAQSNIEPQKIKSSIRTVSDDADIQTRGGAVGNMYIRIADLLGNRDLAIVRNIKSGIKSSGSFDDKVSAFSKKFKEPQDFLAIKNKAKAIVGATINDIQERVSDLEAHGNSPEILNKTKLVAAESSAELTLLLKQLSRCSSFVELIAALYGKFMSEQIQNYQGQKMNMLRSFYENDVAGNTPAQAVSAADVSPVESHVLSTRRIIKRRRNTTVIKPKFQKNENLLRILENSLNLKDSDATDAGKNDMSNSASKDVRFSIMRNSINSGSDITGSDVADYLERAADLNDEVDTIAFGLETSDNEIVKVYVSAQQADAFEAEMQQLLGVEDDIENAINTLAQKFDIVDVVWPSDDIDKSIGNVDSDDSFELLSFDDNEFEVLDNNALGEREDEYELLDK